jgi:hypothetical protein
MSSPAEFSAHEVLLCIYGPFWIHAYLMISDAERCRAMVGTAPSTDFKQKTLAALNSRAAWRRIRSSLFESVISASQPGY